MNCIECGADLGNGYDFAISAGLSIDQVCPGCYSGSDVNEDEQQIDWRASSNMDNPLYAGADLRKDFSAAVVSKIGEWWSSGRRVITLSGNRGSGKTHCAHALGYYLHDTKGLRVRMVEAATIADIHRGCSMGDDKALAKRMLLNMTHVVILDDFGTERETSTSYEAIFSFINTFRGRLVITTNLNSSGIMKRYDERIFSRMQAGYTLSFTGRDRRADGIESRVLEVA